MLPKVVCARAFDVIIVSVRLTITQVENIVLSIGKISSQVVSFTEYFSRHNTLDDK